MKKHTYKLHMDLAFSVLQLIPQLLDPEVELPNSLRQQYEDLAGDASHFISMSLRRATDDGLDEDGQDDPLGPIRQAFEDEADDEEDEDNEEEELEA